MSNQEDILDPEEIAAEISRFSEESESEVQTLEETEGIAESADIEGTELDQFETADIEELLFIEEEHIESILESLLFASDKPVSFATMKELFKGTNVSKEHLKRAIDKLSVEYAGSRRGVVLEDVSGGYQLRTKVDNMSFLRRLLKGRSFRLSGPALEVLSIVAYKQPVIKSEIDVIRGVESGHLLRALMEKGLVTFEGKSDLPGRPMQYSTTKKFLEIFGLRNLKELPTLSQIDELLPEGIGAEEEKKETLSDITDTMAQTVVSTYSDSEEDLQKIQSALSSVDTTTAFFEEEKKRIKLEENKARAQDIREAISVGETVDSKDIKWLSKFEAEQAALIASSIPQTIVEEAAAIEAVSPDAEVESLETTSEPAPEETPQA